MYMYIYLLIHTHWREIALSPSFNFSFIINFKIMYYLCKQDFKHFMCFNILQIIHSMFKHSCCVFAVFKNNCTS